MTEFVTPPIKLENRNQDMYVNIPVSKAKNVRKLLDANLEWKRGGKYELLESEASVKHKFNPSGIKLFYYHLKQKSKPKGVIFTVHGYGASQRIEFSWFANHCASKGYEIVGFDNETFGRNVEKKPDRAFVKKFQKLPWNTAYFIEYILKQEGKRYDNIPLFVLGMSMGGGVVGNVLCNPELRKTCNKLSGAVLWAPLVDPNAKPPGVVMAGLVVASSILPKMEFGPGVINMSVSYEDSLKWFEDHPDSFPFPVKIAMARELVRLGEYFKKNAKNIVTPMLVVHGDKDNMCVFKSTLEMFKNVKSKIKTLIRLKDIMHLLYFDHCTEDVIGMSEQWLDFRVGDFEKKYGKNEEVEGEGEEEEEEISSVFSTESMKSRIKELEKKNSELSIAVKEMEMKLTERIYSEKDMDAKIKEIKGEEEKKYNDLEEKLKDEIVIKNKEIEDLKLSLSSLKKDEEEEDVDVENLALDDETLDDIEDEIISFEIEYLDILTWWSSQFLTNAKKFLRSLDISDETIGGAQQGNDKLFEELFGEIQQIFNYHQKLNDAIDAGLTDTSVIEVYKQNNDEFSNLYTSYLLSYTATKKKWEELIKSREEVLKWYEEFIKEGGISKEGINELFDKPLERLSEYITSFNKYRTFVKDGDKDYENLVKLLSSFAKLEEIRKENCKVKENKVEVEKIEEAGEEEEEEEKIEE